ncbi:MAG: PadR family transcriptional regulator, partial [Nitrososphaeria archaeon]|nr:PadR family transcriptional regulator [Nitrososphaeria archaeon]
SEIMDTIEKETKGLWRPSPGSVYPLLAWLVDKGFIKEVQKGVDGMKRYTLTEEGKTFLKNAKDIEKEFGSLKFIIPTLISQVGLTPRKEDIQMKMYLTRLFTDIVNFRKSFEINPDKEMFDEVCKIIKEACERIENVLSETSRVNS